MLCTTLKYISDFTISQEDAEKITKLSSTVVFSSCSLAPTVVFNNCCIQQRAMKIYLKKQKIVKICLFLFSNNVDLKNNNRNYRNPF